MGSESMKIVIGADLKQSIAAIGNLTDALAGINTSADGATAGLNKIPLALRPIDPAKLKSLSDAVKSFKQEVASFPKNPVPDPLKNIPKGANQAAFALSNVGRVAQDVPFGFIGIQNNLNPLLESFQRLKAETGSSSLAFKALGTSLIGPAGIGLALSIVSSAIVIFQNGIAGFNKKTKEAKDAADDFVKTLKSVDQVAAQSAASEQGNIAKVQALANVISDTNRSYTERNRALNELKDINKGYFGDLTLEADKLDILAAKVDEYTKALKAQAVLKGFTDEIGRVSVELAKQEVELLKTQNRVDQLRKKLSATPEALTSATGEERVSAAFVKIRKEVQAAEKEFNDQRDIVETISTNYAQLSGRIDEATKATLQFQDTNSKEGKKEEDLLKRRLEALEKIKDATKDAAALVGLQEAIFELQVKIAIRDQGKNQLSKEELDQQISGFKTDLQKAFEAQAIELEAIPKVRFRDVSRVEIPADIDSKIAKATGLDKKIPEITIQQVRIKLLGIEKGTLINETEKILDELSKNLRQVMQQGIADAFSGIGEAFGEALTTGDFGAGLKKAAQSILSVLGGVMQTIGKEVIIAALKIKLLKEALEKFAIKNPALAILAGVGLIAAGAALKNLKFDGPKFGDGGIVTGPVIGQIGEKFKPEVVIPLERLPQLFRSMGGDSGGGLQIIPFINNEGLALAVKRGERRTGRKF